MTDQIATLPQLLEAMADLKDRYGNKSRQNFERWLLANGEAGRNPVVGELGPPKHCFQNAYEAAMYDCPDGYAYTEGKIAVPGLPIDIDHAWLQNEAGDVIEVTLRDVEGVQYWGVPFTRQFLAEQIAKLGYYGILVAQGVAYNPDIVGKPLTSKSGRAWPQKEKA